LTKLPENITNKLLWPLFWPTLYYPLAKESIHVAC
jgi:hypothetical protein